MIPDFAFYTDTYLGEAIPEKQFDRCICRAKDALDFFIRTFTVTGGQTEQQMALCAMAETVYRLGRREGVVSASAGSVSVRYQEAADRKLWRELYGQARIYLDITRGVRPC